MKYLYEHDNKVIDLNLESLSSKASCLVKGGGGDDTEAWRPTHDL